MPEEKERAVAEVSLEQIFTEVRQTHDGMKDVKNDVKNLRDDIQRVDNDHKEDIADLQNQINEWKKKQDNQKKESKRNLIATVSAFSVLLSPFITFVLRIMI